MHLLRALADHLHEQPGDPVPAELRQRLIEACVSVEYGKASLGEALGIDFHRRDSALRRAGEILHPAPEPYCRADAILKALSAFERRRREPSSEVEHCLEAARLAGPVPRSRKQLARICGKFIDLGPWT